MTVKMKYDGDTSGCSCVELNSTKTWYSNVKLQINGTSSYQTKSITLSVPANYYICILNETEVTGYYTAEFVQ